ncbi:MAG: hypothetical protein H3C31_05745 [Brumimicrobium sp.]|nr:hypothetical protein [Brumimicrobium sp.]
MDNEKKLNLLGLIIKIVFAVPALILSFIVMTSGVTGDSDETAKQGLMDSVSFSGAINISIWATVIAIFLVILFFALTLASRPKEGIKSIAGIIISFVLFFVLYFIGTNDTIESLNVVGDIVASKATMNFVHAGIWTAIIGMIVCSLIAMLMGFIMKFIKN